MTRPFAPRTAKSKSVQTVGPVTLVTLATVRVIQHCRRDTPTSAGRSIPSNDAAQRSMGNA
ncbi:hypothetical protein C8039_15850 [Halogeometricum sp. wsp3]|nr:hypothetical protein C8039_15850 [Halogeometricum sp. wsp3]